MPLFRDGGATLEWNCGITDSDVIHRAPGGIASLRSLHLGGEWLFVRACVHALALCDVSHVHRVSRQRGTREHAGAGARGEHDAHGAAPEQCAARMDACARACLK